MKIQNPNQHGDKNIQINNYWAEHRRSLVIIAASLLGVVMLVAGTVIYYGVRQPDSAVASQHALDEDRQQKDSATSPVRAESVSGPLDAPGSLASVSVIDLDGSARDEATLKRLLPDALTLGQFTYDSWTGRVKAGYGAGEMYFKLTGQNFTPVQITGIAARVVERRPPPAGTIVASFPQGESPALELKFDLSAGDIVQGKVAGDQGKFTDQDYVKLHAITLAMDETIAFKINVTARECDCRYLVDIGFADGRSYTIDDGGKPFRFTTPAASYARAYVPMLDSLESNYPNDLRLRLCEFPSGCEGQYIQVRQK